MVANGHSGDHPSLAGQVSVAHVHNGNLLQHPRGGFFLAKDRDAPKFHANKRGSSHMKKLMIALALAFAVVGGALVAPTLTNTHAAACTSTSCGCSFAADRGFRLLASECPV